MVLKIEEEKIRIFQNTSPEIFYFAQETGPYLGISVCTPTIIANNIYVKNISNINVNVQPVMIIKTINKSETLIISTCDIWLPL